MNSKELRKRFLQYFADNGHTVIPSASLVPENDPTVLFTTAGMHPLVPYIMGEKHPGGTRLANVQKCIRTGDIEEVGDETHLTFFEMLGNWSLGDYGRADAIRFSFEFLTKHLGIKVTELAVTCFEGIPGVEADLESKKIWLELGIPEKRIKFLGKDDNFWGPPGIEGPCGPDTEMFVWTGYDEAPEEYDPADPNWMEIWNDVFMEYRKSLTESGKEILASGGDFIEDEHFEYLPLAQKNIDTGMGLERVAAYLQGKSDIYSTELFWPIIKTIEELSGLNYEQNLKAFRIIADHLKAAVFIVADGVAPSNKDRGYILRRLIRRAIRYADVIGIQTNFSRSVVEVVQGIYSDTYQSVSSSEVVEQIETEENKFRKTVADGLKKAEEVFSRKKPINEMDYSRIMQLDEKGEILKKIYHNLESKRSLPEYGIAISDDDVKEAYITGKEAFDLFQSYGFPKEMIKELAQSKGLFVSFSEFKEELGKHQDLSRTASAGMFKGGLADDQEATAKLHTAAHLMLAALRRVLGDHVVQRGSNITSERLRFDFSHPEKMTAEQISDVESLVNEQIKKNIPVDMQEMSIEDAKACGAMGIFESKYGDNVKVYTVGDFSKEICGGPHVNHTGDLGTFRIKKEESSSAGVRRIKAILE